MPNKTIYVAEDDLPVLARAQELAGGNLSAAIVRSVRLFVEREEGEMAGHTEIRLTAGPVGAQTRKHFLGTRLAGWEDVPTAQPDQRRADVWTSYRTARGRVAVHHRWADRLGRWRHEQGEFARFLREPADPDGRFADRSGTTLTVYESFAAMRKDETVPRPLVRRTRHLMTTPDVEVLDI